MTLQNEKAKFNNVAKLMLKSQLSKNIGTRVTYKQKIIEAYNNFLNYIAERYDTSSEENKTACKDALNFTQNKLVACLNNLNCKHNIKKGVYETILPEQVGQPQLENIVSDSDSNEESIDISILYENTDIMAAITNIEFLRLCGETIPTSFTGDPLHLTAFINAIDLLNNVATTAQNTAELIPLLTAFIKTRLNAKSSEYLTELDLTINQIKTRLSASIKPENDKIIKGKMAALKADRNSLQEFAKQAEQLSDSLKRALILDGIPSAKANAMVIDETINMCKNTARSDYVKTVLASSAFTSPKEVVAKFIVEVGNDKTDKQVLAFHSMKKQFRPTNQRGGRNPRQNNNNRQNYSNYSNNYNNNPRFRNNRQNGNHYTNRGNYNNNQRYNGHNRQNNFSNRNHNIHYTAAENSSVPQRQLGEQSLQMQNQPLQQQF